MITVSEDFKKAVYAPTRKIVGKVAFEILDNKAYDNIKKVSSEAEISLKEQLSDKEREMSFKIASFEKDYFKLDGSYCLPNNPSKIDKLQIGWWSEVLSGEDGNFNPYQTLEFIFKEEISSVGLTIYFDTLSNEYCRDFDITFYDINNIILREENIIDNLDSKYTLESPINDYVRVVITLKKWCKGYRRAKVVEIDFGIVKEYTDDKLIKMNLIEEVSIINNTLPSNEVKITIDNSSKEFNILNPNGSYKYLKEKQEIKSYLGLELENKVIEYIPLGKYYLKEWQSDEMALTATFTARDIIDVLEQENYKFSTLKDMTLYEFAKNVLDNAGISYEIDENLKEIFTNGYMPIVSFRTVLQYIGIVGRCAIYQDRETDKLILKQFKTLNEGSSYLLFCSDDIFCGMTVPQVADGYDIKNITLDNMYSEPKIKLDNQVGAIEMVVSTYNGESEEVELLNINADIQGEETIFLELKDGIYGNPNISVTGAIKWSFIGNYTNGCMIKIKAAGAVNIKILGHKLVITKNTYTLRDPSVKDGITLKIDNPLINTPKVAKDIAEWVFAESKLRAMYEINWRQNPALECTDFIIVEDGFGEKKQSRVTKQEFVYQGYLSGKTESKGGI